MGKLFSIDFEIVAPEKAVVPVMDRGFLYGDSVYEVIRTYRKTIPFLLDKHYARMLRSAERILLKIPFTLEKLTQHIVECVKRVDNPDSYVRIVVSRGEDTRFSLLPPVEERPRTVIYVDTVTTYPPAHFENGINIALVSVRRNLRSAVDPNIKSGNYLNNMLALMEAHRQKAEDAVMLNFQDAVTEGTTSNIFIVKDGEVLTPEVESGLLEGTSRALLKELMKKSGVAYREAEIHRDQFLAADEIFLTGTTKEVMPVTRVDGKPIGSGRPGPVTQKLMMIFRAEVERIIAA